jgi:hypothetical protein
MTNLPTVFPKNPPADGVRTEMGNFFQMPGREMGGNLSDSDFDRFMADHNSSELAGELREEQEAANKRKKPVDAGLAAPLTQQEVLLQEPEESAPKGNGSMVLDAKQTSNLDATLSDHSKKNESISTDIKNGEIKTYLEIPESIEPKQTADSNLPIDAFAFEDKSSISAKENFESPEKTKPDSESHGIEPAPSDVEMMAIAKLDPLDSPVQPLLEPSITTINRLAAFDSLEKSAVAALDSSGRSSDSGLGYAANGVAIPAQFVQPQSPSPSAQASALFKSLGPELDKFKQTGSSQIQLDLPVGEEESVRIKLSIRGGEIRSTFITESPELRDALQKAWPEFSQNSRDRGFRMGDPAFQQSFQENSANMGQNNRRPFDSSASETSELFATVGNRKPLANSNTSPKLTSTALWA